MLIREMKPEDSGQVAAIHTLAWQHAYRGIIDQDFLDAIDLQKRELNWRKGVEANEPPLVRLVLEKAGQVVAFVCGLENRSPSQLPRCDSELWAIYVHPSHAGRGVGRALLDEFASNLRNLGKTRFCVWVLKENCGARQFYERQGGVVSQATKESTIGQQKLIELAYEFNLLSPTS